jgi:hypothetical protein
LGRKIAFALRHQRRTADCLRPVQSGVVGLHAKNSPRVLAPSVAMRAPYHSRLRGSSRRRCRAASMLVCCPGNNMVCVALKTARHPGATKARCRCASQLRSNAGAGLFSAQPFRPQSFGRRPVLLARPVSRPIQALRSRLGRRPNPKRRTPCYFRDSTLELSPPTTTHPATPFSRQPA